MAYGRRLLLLGAKRSVILELADVERYGRHVDPFSAPGTSHGVLLGTAGWRLHGA